MSNYSEVEFKKKTPRHFEKPKQEIRALSTVHFVSMEIYMCSMLLDSLFFLCQKGTLMGNYYFKICERAKECGLVNS